MKTVKQILILLFWLAICQLPSLTSSSVVQQNFDCDHALNRPLLTPLDAIFGLAWAALSHFLVFKNLSGKNAQKALFPFWTQLLLNACWTPLFFGLHLTGTALLLLAAMLIQGIWLAYAFWRASRSAGILLLPYGLWLAYAAYLNMGFWLLNP